MTIWLAREIENQNQKERERESDVFERSGIVGMDIQCVTIPYHPIPYHPIPSHTIRQDKSVTVLTEKSSRRSMKGICVFLFSGVLFLFKEKEKKNN